MRFKQLVKNSILMAGVLVMFFLGHSCIDERISHDPSLRLAFSQDTLLFDTVFTTIGSSTQLFKVYNPNNKNVAISSVSLAGGANSPYRINVDGEQSKNNRFENIELRARDSLFVFVEVNVDPLNDNSPVFIKDSIIFDTNSQLQNVKLIAYGQDMEVLHNREIKNDSVLTGIKPYVLYGDLVVDSAATLTLDPGCSIYFHDQTSLVVYGNLRINGTPESPVLLRGDRTDRLFEEVPYNFVSNQWGGVLLLNKEGDHYINHAVINSGYVGLFFQNNDRNFRPKLEVHNSRIHNFLKYGLVAQNGDLLVTNSEISNTGSYSVYLNGGFHHFVHCTIANYFNNTNILMQPSGKDGSTAVMIYELNRIVPMESRFENCVIAGSGSSEFDILSRFEERYNGVFKNSYIKKSEPETDLPMFKNVVWYNRTDTLFKNSFYNSEEKIYYNYMPDSVAPFRNIGDPEVAQKYPLDLNGNNRLLDGMPDAGAYEWQPAEPEEQ